MARFLLKRLGLAAITLVLLSVLVFALAQLLPGNIGRNLDGPFASPQQVALTNHELGVDKPIVVQYAKWISRLARGNLGSSLEYKVPVSHLLGPSLGHSPKLAALPLLLAVPLRIVGRVPAARPQRRDTELTLAGGGPSPPRVPE